VGDQLLQQVWKQGSWVQGRAGARQSCTIGWGSGSSYSFCVSVDVRLREGIMPRSLALPAPLVPPFPPPPSFSIVAQLPELQHPAGPACFGLQPDGQEAESITLVTVMCGCRVVLSRWLTPTCYDGEVMTGGWYPCTSMHPCTCSIPLPNCVCSLAGTFCHCCARFLCCLDARMLCY
jgi:hypothetical protein